MSLDLLQDTKILETHMIRDKGQEWIKEEGIILCVCLEMKNGFASVQSSIL